MEEALKRLCERRRFGIRPGLDLIRALTSELGEPQRSFAAVHVAGTNGKGSVCAMAAAVLEAMGLRVGLYTSPHLVRFNERIRVNGVDIADEDLAVLLDVVDSASRTAALKEGRESTFFEFATALAFAHFARRSVQVAVVEVGMGGRLDATNIVEPLVCGITPIGVEHTVYLGATLEEIAGEKAGIIKNGRPVICASMGTVAMDVLRKTARDRGAPFIEADAAVSIKRASGGAREVVQALNVESTQQAYGRVDLPLAGEHQLSNLGVALLLVEQVASAVGVELSASVLRKGVAAVRWPARFELVCREPPVVLDGAHNPAAAQALARTLRIVFGNRPVGLIVGMCADKDIRGVLTRLLPVSSRVWAVSFDNERAVAPEEMVNIATSLGMSAVSAALPEALEAARGWAKEAGGVVCVTGSLFLAGDARVACGPVIEDPS